MYHPKKLSNSSPSTLQNNCASIIAAGQLKKARTATSPSGPAIR
jgi:hypothetical protein